MSGLPWPELFMTALTHSSWAHEHGGEHNERLEFLGDAVLELCISDLLYHRFPEQREGVLSRARQRLVEKETLADLARELGLDQALRLGSGEQTEALRGEAKPLSDVWEAMLGAIYLSLGLEAAREIVAAKVLPRLDRMRTTKDAKSHLQEWCQQHYGGEVPTYRLVGREGPDNDPRWSVQVEVAGRVLGQGSARRKKEAEQEAATSALHSLGLRP